MCSKFSHFVAGVRTSPLFVAESYSIVYIYSSLFIHSVTDMWADMNAAAASIHYVLRVDVCFHLSWVNNWEWNCWVLGCLCVPSLKAPSTVPTVCWPCWAVMSLVDTASWRRGTRKQAGRTHLTICVYYQDRKGAVETHAQAPISLCPRAFYAVVSPNYSCL